MQSLAIIPTFVVQVLSDELQGWLGPKGLFLGHVEVVDEDDALLANGRTIVSLPPLLHLGVDRVLSLVGPRLGRKSQRNVLVGVSEPGGQQFGAVERLASPGGAESQHMVIPSEQEFDQVSVSD